MVEFLRRSVVLSLVSILFYSPGYSMHRGDSNPKPANRPRIESTAAQATPRVAPVLIAPPSFSNLPSVLGQHSLSFLDPSSLARASCINRYNYALSLRTWCSMTSHKPQSEAEAIFFLKKLKRCNGARLPVRLKSLDLSVARPILHNPVHGELDYGLFCTFVRTGDLSRIKEFFPHFDERVASLLPPGLEQLSLSNLVITDEGMREVVRILPDLRALNLSSAIVSKLGLLIANQLRNLQSLNMSRLFLSEGRWYDKRTGSKEHPELPSQFFANLPMTLRVLKVDNTKVIDGAFAGMVEACPDLVELNLSATDITGTGLIPLGKLSKLEKLGLSDLRLTDKDLVPLRSLIQLKSLDLSGGMNGHQVVPYNQISDEGLLNLEPLVQLEHLNLRANLITDQGLAFLGMVSSLKSLDVSKGMGDRFVSGDKTTNSRITSEGLMSLTSLVHLENLDISGTHALKDRGVQPLLSLQKLRELHLGGHDQPDLSKLSDNELSSLSGFPHLEVLDLNQYEFTADLDLLPTPERIKGLHMDATDLNEQALSKLKKFVNLEELTFRVSPNDLIQGSSRLPSSYLSFLPYLTKLKKLRIISPRPFSKLSFPYFEELRELQYLELSGSSMTTKTWSFLSGKYPNLTLSERHFIRPEYPKRMINFEDIWLGRLSEDVEAFSDSDLEVNSEPELNSESESESDSESTDL